MRRLLPLAFLIFIVFGSLAQAGVTVVQTAFKTGGVASTLATALPAQPAASDYIIVMGYGTNNSFAATVKDNNGAGNTIPAINDAQQRNYIHGYYSPGGLAGKIIQVSTSAGNVQDMAIIDLSGVVAANNVFGNCGASTPCTATPAPVPYLNSIAFCVGNNASGAFSTLTLENISGSATVLYTDATNSIASYATTLSNTDCKVTATSGTVRASLAVAQGQTPANGCPPFPYPCYFQGAYLEKFYAW